MSTPTMGEAPAGCPRKGPDMKYMIMMFGGLGATLSTRSADWIKGMGELMMLSLIHI